MGLDATVPAILIDAQQGGVQATNNANGPDGSGPRCTTDRCLSRCGVDAVRDPRRIGKECSYIPGKANLKLIWPAYVVGCVAYSYETTVLERRALMDIRRYTVVIFLAALVFCGLRRAGVIFVKR